MPGLRLMKRAGFAAIFLAALPAFATEAAFRGALDKAPWAGCVYQEGFEPYPIELTPRGHDFFVIYPGLCTGGHNTSLRPEGFDALEVIIVNADRCLQNVPVAYSLNAGTLRIDYDDGTGGSFALLRRMEAGAIPPTCPATEAIS